MVIIEKMLSEKTALDNILKKLGIPDVKTLDDYNLILLTSSLLVTLSLRHNQDRLFNKRITAAYDITVKYLLQHKPLEKPEENPYLSKEVEGF
jgi:hypothetical protein